MAVDTLGLCLQQDILLVGTHNIAVNMRQLYAGLNIIRIKDDARLFSRAETLSHNLLTTIRHLTIALTVKEGINAINLPGIISTATEVGKLDFSCCMNTGKYADNSYQKE